MFTLIQNRYFIPLLLIIIALLVGYILGSFFGIFKQAQPQEQRIGPAAERKAVISEATTVFESGRAAVASVDAEQNILVATVTNPNYSGGPKNVEAVYQKKNLLITPQTEIVEITYEIPKEAQFRPIGFGLLSVKERQISLSDLNIGDQINFFAEKKFDFYGTDNIVVKRIERIK